MALTEDFRAVWQLTSMSLGVGVFAIPLTPQVITAQEWNKYQYLIVLYNYTYT